MTLLELLRRTEAWLGRQGVDAPRLTAELILAHVLRLRRMDLYLAFDRPMTDDELATIRPLVQRRGKREPLAWILETVGFHGVDLDILPGVLVPRADTETLVDAALAWIGDADPTYVADVGCGSGAVGLALAHARPGVRLYAIDPAEAAITVTRRNVMRLSLTDRVGVLAGRWLEPIPAHRPLDWVVSNPPYIPSAHIDALSPEVSKWEPRLALDGGADGLHAYRTLIPLAAQRARHGILLEVGHDQADAVTDILRQSGYPDVATWNDLQGIRRVVGGRRG